MNSEKIMRISSSGRKRTEEEIIASYYSNYKVKCKCGHTMVITNSVEKKICSYCGNYVYRNKKLEFKDKLIKELRKKND